MLGATKSKSESSMIAVLRYMVHVVLQYATDVNNLIIKNLRLRIWGKDKNCDVFVLKIVWNTPSPT